jgi:hypothetical protein
MSLLKNKIVMLVLAGVVLAGIVWYSFLGGGGVKAPLLTTEDLTAQGAIDSDVVAILLQLRAVSLSGTIFSDPVFRSLQDFGSEIVPEPVGRQNPFAPLGATSNIQTQTGTSSNSQMPPPQTAPRR